MTTRKYTAKLGTRAQDMDILCTGFFDTNAYLFVRKGLIKSSLVIYPYDSKSNTYSDESKTLKLIREDGKAETLSLVTHMRVSATDIGYIMTYIRKSGPRAKTTSHDLMIAVSHDFIHWHVVSSLTNIKHESTAIHRGDITTLLTGGLFIRGFDSTNLKQWKKHGLISTSRSTSFDSGPIILMGATLTNLGLLIAYDASDVRVVRAGMILVDPNEPSRVIWRSNIPLVEDVLSEDVDIQPLGGYVCDKILNLDWRIGNSIMNYQVSLESFGKLPTVPKIYPLKRSHKNPVLVPRKDHSWEYHGTFNPGVVYKDGVFHVMYRAVGSDGVSTVGYAASNDGQQFHERSDKPIYRLIKPDSQHEVYDPYTYPSGGSWGGCEDPRIVLIEDRVYMTYVAFGDWGSLRMALTSIKYQDLINGRYRWTKAHFMSPAHEMHKNWVIFPEKINGKFAILHGIVPRIMIEYVDDLKNIDIIKSERPYGPQPGRFNYWDKSIRGAGPPPLRTKYGWLLLYHANDTREPHKYKLGALLLDINDPTIILSRSATPLLEPDMSYENEGKPGIVYASGAVIKDDTLFVFYGGGDRVVCVAKTPIDEFLDALIHHKESRIMITRNDACFNIT